MSEINLNLVDSKQVLHGPIHAAVADRAMAALTAEPETIHELEFALGRYQKQITASGQFPWFRQSRCVDPDKWDAGVMIIDLSARLVALDSTYSHPSHTGEVSYHDGVQATDVSVPYSVSDDWLFVDAIEDYERLRDERRQLRDATAPLDARAILYGRPLLEFIAREISALELFEGNPCKSAPTACSPIGKTGLPPLYDGAEEGQEHLTNLISAVHAKWLETPREDLRERSPREVLLAKQDFIDFDLHSRELQWTLLGEGPPCLATDSSAYRFAGFGTHEWVIYYDLVRDLLWSALERETVRRSAGETRRTNGNQALAGGSQQIWSAPPRRRFGSDDQTVNTTPVSGWAPAPVDGGGNPASDSTARFSACVQADVDAEIARLEELKAQWLEQPQPDYSGRIPALLIENERKRLPLAMLGRDMVIDDDCPVCHAMATDPELSNGVGFWHLDGSHMEEEFAFSPFRTREEWEAENRRREEFSQECDRRWREKRRIGRGEEVDDDFNLDWIDLSSSGPI